MKKRINKNFTAMVLLGAIAFPILPINYPTAHAQNVTIDGQNLRSGISPIKRNGRTLVAMRPIFEGLGASVQWDAGNKRITAKTSSTTVIMQIGNSMALVDGRPTYLEQAPLLYMGNTMVPLRFVSESLGAQVFYDAPSNNIGIVTSQSGQPSNSLSNNINANYQQPGSGASQLSNTVNGVSVNLAKNLYAPNEPIKLNFTAPVSLPSSAWAGIVPADTPAGSPDVDNSQHLAYQYLGKKTRGTLAFKAPTTAGHYIIRVNQGQNQYSSVGFEVQPTTPDATPQIAIEKDVYVPGEPIDLHFEAFPFYSSSAWVGVLPSDVEHGSEELNNKNHLAYQYIGGKTQGKLPFKAPTKLGQYDFRLNDSYGHEIASIPFSVEPTTPEVTPTMSIDKAYFDKKELITVHFTAFPFYSGSAWVGLVPAEIDHGSEELNNKNHLAYQYIDGKTQGVLTFKAPSTDGVYDFRFHDGHGNEIASTPEFTVGDGGSNRDRGRNLRRDNQDNQYQDDQNYQDNNQGNVRQKGRAEGIYDDVADDAAEAAKESLKDRIRRKIFK